MDAILLMGVRRQAAKISESLRQLMKSLPMYARPTLWDHMDGPTHEVYVVRFNDDRYRTLRTLAIEDGLALFPFCDHDGRTDAIVSATLQEYGMVLHKDE